MSGAGITAVVPVWNGRALLEKLLASLEAQTCLPAEVLVVDDGSTDGAPDLARERGARVVAMGRNSGFVEAVNRGIDESGTAWVAILNSDVILAPDYFARLLAAAESSNAWFATGKILSAGSADSIDATFDVVSRAATAWRVGSGRRDCPVFSQAQTISAVPWTAALFRRGVFARVGTLDARYEMYLEDVDFGLRCAAQGIGGVYVPEALAWHHGSASLGRWHPDTVRRIARNQVFLIARHYSTPLLLRCLWAILVGQLLWGALALQHGTGSAWLRGKWQGLRGFSSFRSKMNTAEAKVLGRWLVASEQIIRQAQQATFFDRYWRLYFLLTRPVAK